MNLTDVLHLPLSTGVFYFLSILVVLTVVVFIHELGHFLVARWCGVDIEAFSIGFGREILGWNDKHGTRWKVAWLPLGGYVRFRGDANAASMPDAEAMQRAKSDPGNFHGKPLWQRAAVVAAGPIANFILAIAIFAGAFMIVGRPVIEPRVDEVVAGSAAEAAGIRKGDLFLSVDGLTITDFAGLQQAVMTRAGEPLSVIVDRNGEKINLTIIPQLKEESDNFGGKIRLGLLGVKRDPMGPVHVEKMGPITAIQTGAEQTWFIISTTLKYLGKLLVGRESPDQLGGLISMTKGAGDSAQLGFLGFVKYIAFLSVSIGLLNLFPIPMLDGGHLVYYAIEAIRGRALSERVQEWGFRIGFSLVMLLLLMGNGFDLIRLKNMFGG
jgi:regulator of sigma E protease